MLFRAFALKEMIIADRKTASGRRVKDFEELIGHLDARIKARKKTLWEVALDRYAGKTIEQIIKQIQEQASIPAGRFLTQSQK